MIKTNNSEKKGISLIALLITISVMLILLTVIVISVDNVSNNSKLSAFATDLSTIEDLTNTYYMQNNSFPVKTESGKENEDMVMTQGVLLDRVGNENKDKFIEELKLNNDYNLESDDLGEYYPIDLSKLDIESSKRGTLKDGDTKDIYVVAYPSMNIYYIKGIKVKKDMYFSLSSKLTNRVKLDKDMTYKNDNTTTVQSIDGLTVKKMTKSWTNSMGIYVQANLKSGEEIYLEATNLDKKKLVTNDGNNEFSFNDLSEINGFTIDESNTFKSADQKVKKIVFTKEINGEILGKIEVDMSNYETILPYYQIVSENIVYSEEYNMIPINVGDNISGVKEVRYEYLTKYDEYGNIQNYYANVSEYDVDYLKSKGKKAIPDKNGNITLKIDKDIQGIQLVVIDKAGNTLSQNEKGENLTVGMYNDDSDIYIGLNLKSNIQKLLSYGVILINKNGISNLEISTSTDGINYSDVRTIEVNSTQADTLKIVEDRQENLGIIRFLKITAIDNYVLKNKRTRVFKLDTKKTLEIGKITDESQTFNLKSTSTYYNPIIPKGFAPINEGDAIWGSAEGWAKGLVIQDALGNEFVWVPVTSVDTYAKDTSFPGIPPTGDDTLPSGITDETSDVEKYGGFYIGRYEAGIPKEDTSPSDKTGVPVSKKGATVWTDISYTNAKASAESMISNDNVQTGLLTGKAWDTTCHWIEDYIITLNANSTLKNSIYYGNYENSTFTYTTSSGVGATKLSNEDVKIPTGSTEYTNTKNIYDLAGNVWEWTAEMASLNRGGSYYSGGDAAPISCRNFGSASGTDSSVGFRTRLYIK